ncbi:YdbH domain-containing protein [Pseudomonas stutzeri]|uniref:Dicarboxylate transport n=1 Tax=Stutzerimonas stutzeri TaxID=316 RepID=A0A2N8S6P2_STUST|nr:YdbH domain-containing protein [Stutzerimonas stutzeri]MCQ4294595.1 YdbH domain-containing protein [Stutzerimonas stutzeri]PNF82298.1 dicarboxylate transport [Stutzerimonas stutzeri]
MTKPSRILLWLLLGLLGLASLAGGFAWYQWNMFKREQGIERLEWENLRVSTQGITVSRLNYEQRTVDGLAMAAQADNVALRIPSLSKPLPARSLHIDRIQFTLLSLPDAPEDHSPAPDLEQYERWAAWLPQRLTIDDLQLDLPCANGRCDERGALQLQHAGESLLPLEARLDLRRNQHQLSLTISAQRSDELHSLIEAKLLIDGQPRLETRHQLDSTNELLWNGTLSMGSLPEAPWLLEWLGEWTSYQPATLPDMPTDMRLGAGWALALPQAPGAGFDWRDAAGDLRLSAHLPAFWPVIGLGELQGEIDLAANGQNGLWLPTELKASLKLRPEPTMVAELPKSLRPTLLNLDIVPMEAETAQGRLPLQLRLESQGSTPATLQARVQLATAPPYTLDVEQARLQLRSSKLQLDALSLQGLEAALSFSGRADFERIALQVDKTSRVTLARMTSAEFAASQLRAELPQPLSLQIERSGTEPITWRLRGPVELRLGTLEHPQLISQGWRWSSQLDVDATRLNATGPLSNDAGLALATSLNNAWNGSLQVSGKLQEIFLRAGNPFARSFTAWPAALELNSGRLLGDGKFSLPTGSGVLSASLALEARGLAGIYDRTEISGLDARLAGSLQHNRLQMDITELRLAQLNPGFTFGPLLLRGAYNASLDQPGQGRLSWQTAETQILGGRFSLEPASLDLAAAQQQLNAHLQGVQLSELLAAYPTEGLSGSGHIDGSFEIHRSATGLSVDQGQLAARAPGGVLRFRSPKIEALAQANPAMRIVSEALHDFHYDLLSSDVRYDESGKLNLGLRLNGRNPALEGGRPINFSINLEEDIPALLTSLQLSDRVSETIQRRVQERLR